MALANPIPPLSLVQAIRFWKKVEKRGHGGCWVWSAPLRGSRKQATVLIDGRHYSCRRVAWELEHGYGQLGPRVTLLPKCGNLLCVRPSHMEVSLGARQLRREACRRGHKLVEGNIYYTSQGKRACKTCITIKLAERRERYLKEGRGWGKTYVPLGRRKRSERSQVGGKNRTKK